MDTTILIPLAAILFLIGLLVWCNRRRGSAEDKPTYNKFLRFLMKNYDMTEKEK